MSSTALSVYPHLPPTTNILNSQQRARLVRSTRKLGTVLGTTPYLLENDAPFTILPLGKTPKVLKRQGSVFSHKHPSSSSISSFHFPSSSTPSSRSNTPNSGTYPANPPGLAPVQKSAPRGKPPHLVLQLNTAPLLPDCLASSLTPSPSPTTSLFSQSPSPCPSPVTPTTPISDPTEIRRKRMAKLARHLGEKIPVELVLNPGSAQNSTPVRPVRRLKRRSHSVHIVRDEVAPVCDNGLAPAPQTRSEWVGEWNRANIRDVQKELRSLKIR